MNGRNLSLDDRGRRTTALATKVVRRAEAAKVKVIGATNPSDSSTTKKAPKPARAKAGAAAPTKTEDNQVGYSIQKFLSAYENEKTPTKTSEDRRQYSKQRRYSMMRTPSRMSEDGKETKTKVIRLEPEPKRSAPKKVAPENVRTAAKQYKTASVKAPEELPLKKSAAEELVPVAMQDLAQNVLSSFITSCLDEKSKGTTDLDILLSAGSAVFPICSKRTTDDMPSRLAENKRDLIIMLRRRNSEPYSSKFACGNGQWGLDRIYVLQSSLENQLRPCWEVSLFRANRSLSVLKKESAAAKLSITSPNAGFLPRGEFGPSSVHGLHFSGPGTDPKSFTRAPEPVGAGCKRWLSEIGHYGGPPSVAPLMTLLGRERSVPPALPAPKTIISSSKDDLCKPSVRLRVVVKPCPKKLFSVQSAPNASVNKKTHKLTKLRRTGSELRPTIWHKHILFTVTSAVVLVTGGFLFFLYLLTKSPAYFNLTPPIPGLVRGC